jgi:hypothetical protein
MAPTAPGSKKTFALAIDEKSESDGIELTLAAYINAPVTFAVAIQPIYTNDMRARWTSHPYNCRPWTTKMMELNPKPA